MRKALSRRYLGSDRRSGDVRGAVLVMVVVVRVSASPPVVLLVLLFLALGATFHGVCVGVRVAVCVAQQRGGGGKLLQGGVRGFHPNCCLAQQVDGVRQSGQNELETLLRDNAGDPFKKPVKLKDGSTSKGDMAALLNDAVPLVFTSVASDSYDVTACTFKAFRRP